MKIWVLFLVCIFPICWTKTKKYPLMSWIAVTMEFVYLQREVGMNNTKTQKFLFLNDNCFEQKLFGVSTYLLCFLAVLPEIFWSSSAEWNVYHKEWKFSTMICCLRKRMKNTFVFKKRCFTSIFSGESDPWKKISKRKNFKHFSQLTRQKRDYKFPTQRLSCAVKKSLKLPERRKEAWRNFQGKWYIDMRKKTKEENNSRNASNISFAFFSFFFSFTTHFFPTISRVFMWPLEKKNGTTKRWRGIHCYSEVWKMRLERSGNWRTIKWRHSNFVNAKSENAHGFFRRD